MSAKVGQAAPGGKVETATEPEQIAGKSDDQAPVCMLCPVRRTTARFTARRRIGGNPPDSVCNAVRRGQSLRDEAALSLSRSMNDGKVTTPKVTASAISTGMAMAARRGQSG